ncbi:MAG: helix-turn-helix domain-containing protein [Ottowia sp.]|uniref:IclR family transcriptional regulator n=1 Tax=Ottowia sp. TaxID=1898956 RepID=UPI003C718B88
MTLTPTVKSAARSLQVLEYFEQIQRPAALREVSQTMGWPASSASLLLRTLCEMGYLNRDPVTHEFAPTMRLPLLGGWIRAGRADGHALSQLVNRAREATGLTAVLSSRHGLDVQYIYVSRAIAQGFASRRPSAGTLRPVCLCAAGYMILASESDERIALIARHAAAVLQRKIELAELMEGVNAAREAGYAWQAGVNTPGVGDIAVRLLEDDPFGHPLVLSVAAAAGVIRERYDELGSTLRELVNQFSATLQPALAP